MADVIPDLLYRCPSDLSVTPTSLQRVMIVGQCLMAGWPHVVKSLVPDCECDYFVFNNTQELPANMPHSASDYGFQIVQLPLRSVVPDGSYFRLSYKDVAGYEALFQESCERLRQFLAAAMRWNRAHGILTFVFNFLEPQQNPMGRLLPRYDLRNIVYFIERINEVLAQEVQKYNNAYLFDFDQVIATYGRKYFQDDAVLQTNHNAALADSDYQLDHERLESFPQASTIYPLKTHLYVQLGWTELLAMYRTIRQLDPVKLVVMDIDDTLWRGVAAERVDHPADVVEGWPLGIAETLGHLRRRGILLAVVSKNDENIIKPIWQRLLGGRLALEDFAFTKINWRTKAENFETILQEANLLPHSVVFIDDNPAERAAIESAFPGIRAFGPNPLVWRRVLLWSAETQVPTITAESAMRTQMVQAQVEREGQRKRLSREDFLASLQLELFLKEIDDVEDASFPRALELINKSNQFNTTGRRWVNQECRADFVQGTRFFIFDVKDKYTAYGIVGVIIVRDAHILQFAMSCRVVGMEVESAAIASLLELLKQRIGTTIVSAELTETELNLLARDLWHRCGFKNDSGRWTRDLSIDFPSPPHIKVSTAANAEKTLEFAT